MLWSNFYCKYISKHSSLASQNQKLFIKKHLQNTCRQKKRCCYVPSRWGRWWAASQDQSRWKSTRFPRPCTPPVPGWTWCGWTAVAASHWCSWCTAARRSSAAGRNNHMSVTWQSHEQGYRGKTWAVFLGKSKRTWANIKNYFFRLAKEILLTPQPFSTVRQVGNDHMTIVEVTWESCDLRWGAHWPWRSRSQQCRECRWRRPRSGEFGPETCWSSERSTWTVARRMPWPRPGWRTPPECVRVREGGEKGVEKGEVKLYR